MKTISDIGFDAGEMMETMTYTTSRRDVGGTWVTGEIGGHRFQALVFKEHALSENYEMLDTRTSKFWLADATGTVCDFDRGWILRPTTPAAKFITDMLTDGLAELIFGA